MLTLISPTEVIGDTGIMIVGMSVQPWREADHEPKKSNCPYCRTLHAATNCPNCGAADTRPAVTLST